MDLTNALLPGSSPQRFGIAERLGEPIVVEASAGTLGNAVALVDLTQGLAAGTTWRLACSQLSAFHIAYSAECS
jgi:hypothetical protein